MRPRKIKPKGHIVARYDYTNEQGRILYQVRRHQPKGFSVRSTGGKVIAQDGRFPRVPYRLVELLATDLGQTVFIVEGEKDVDRLHAQGLVATCNAFGGGKGKWKRGHSRYLRGRNVVILPDNDPTGEEHGRAVAKALVRVAATVKVVGLPGLPHKGDVSDWLDAGHTARELLDMTDAAPRWRSSKERLPEPDWSESWERDYDDLRNARRQRHAVYGLPIQPAEKLMLLLLCEYHQPPQEELAQYIGVTPRRVRQLTARLKSLGILGVRKSGRRNTYWVNPAAAKQSAG